MIRKGSKLYSILYQKCPRCHEGDLFESPTWDLLHFSNMKKRCDGCGLIYEKEPSFFTGAMYVSYAMQVAFFVPVLVITHFFFDPSFTVSFSIIVGTVLMMMPLTFRLSRGIWINFFVKYNKNALVPRNAARGSSDFRQPINS